MLLSRIITTALRVGMDSRNVDVENEYKVLQQYFLSDPETRKLFIKELDYEECCEIAQELDISTLAKLIVIKEEGEMGNAFTRYEDLEKYYRDLSAKAPNKEMADIWLAKAYECKNASRELTIGEVTEDAEDNN